jgi:hypothetical protein
MAKNTDRLIEVLRRYPGLDDDQLAMQADIQPRQQVNQICHRLAKAGKLRRANGPNGKIINFLIGADRPSVLPTKAGSV